MINMENKIDKVLDFIVNELVKNKLNFSLQSEDGRVNSTQNEKEIIQFLLENKNIKIMLDQHQLKMIAGKSRQWFDISIEGENEFYPINIKATNLKTNQNDNLNCKLGIYYALTGEKPDFANEIKWKDFFNLLVDRIKENGRDYYFLIISKNNPNDVFWTSLKQINTLVPNGNNLPFQSCWFENKIKIKRNFEEAKNFLINNLETSVKKRAEILDHLTKALKKINLK